jgi:hypothetical protein
MLDLKIDLLRLGIDGAAGCEHRLEGIARRAVALLGDRLSTREGDSGWRGGRVHREGLSLPPVSLDLARLSDERAADAIAAALFEALSVQLRIT